MEWEDVKKTLIKIPERGSGFIISANGYALTCEHILRGISKKFEILYDDIIFNAKIVYIGRNSDFAVIKIEKNNFQEPFPFLVPHIVDKDERDLCIKYTSFTFLEGLPLYANKGKIIDLNFPFEDLNYPYNKNNYFYIPKPVKIGMSGGPIWHISKKNVVGIIKMNIDVTKKLNTRICLAVPMSQVIDEVINNEVIPQDVKRIFGGYKYIDDSNMNAKIVTQLDANIELCLFCLTTKTLTYYCENCGSYCCSDCIYEEKLGYYVCCKCNSKHIKIRREDDTKICMNCGSEDINRVTYNFKYCPKCSSKNILNIYEKKEELEQKFLDMIKNTRSFSEPFIHIANQLILLRDRLKLARDPPIKCYHFPKMEKEMILLIKMFNKVINTLLDKIKIHYHHFFLNQDYFFNIYVQPNSNINVIENILQNLNRSNASIQEYIIGKSQLINEKIEIKHEDFILIDLIHDYFMKYKNILSLSSIEKPIYAIRAICINRYKAKNYSSKSYGILFITTSYLSFIRIYGKFEKKINMSIKISIKDLKKMEKKGNKRIILDFSDAIYEFQLPKQTNTKVLKYMAFAENFEKITKGIPEAAEKLQSLDLDLNNLINYIEETINSFFSLKCKYNQNMNTQNTS